MGNYILIIDGGTTNTRFTLINETQIIDYITKRIGASDTHDSAKNQRLEQAVREAIEHMETTHHCRIGTILAAGMITSNVGLLEVAHLQAPVALSQLADEIKPCKLPHISPFATFYFVPGIKFGTPGGCDSDVLRGEETEIYGAIAPEDKHKNILFVHFGSHNKIVLYEGGSITQNVTTISGELLWAIANHTILKSSIGKIDQYDVVDAYVQKGYEAAQQHNFSRSLFMARINQIIGGFTREQTLSFIYGILMQSDLSAFKPLLNERVDKLVLYGRGQFAKAFLACLNTYGPAFNGNIELLSFEESEQLSIKGLTRVYQDIIGKEAANQ